MFTFYVLTPLKPNIDGIRTSNSLNINVLHGFTGVNIEKVPYLGPDSGLVGEYCCILGHEAARDLA